MLVRSTCLYFWATVGRVVAHTCRQSPSIGAALHYRSTHTMRRLAIAKWLCVEIDLPVGGWEGDGGAHQAEPALCS